MRQQLELPRLLQHFVLGPGVHGRFEDDLADIFKASFLKPLDVVGVARYRTIVVDGSFGNELRPVGEVVGVKKGTVVGPEAAVEFLQLEVAAGLGVSATGVRTW